MQLVIDISEEDYVYIAKKHCIPSCDDRTLRKNFYEMIVNGIPLPKGHGRLIDADATKCSSCGKFGCKNSELCSLYNAQTIIEADGGDVE